jgi:hypothetical protein
VGIEKNLFILMSRNKIDKIGTKSKNEILTKYIFSNEELKSLR